MIVVAVLFAFASALFFLVAPAVSLVLALRARQRFVALEREILNLTGRIALLEHSRITVSSPVAPAAARPEPVRHIVREPAPVPESSVERDPTPPAPEVALDPVVLDPVVLESPLPTSAVQKESLEARIGSRWLLNVGVVAIVVGLIYFEKLALDNHWMSDGARVIQGAAIGSLLLVGGLRLARKGYERYGQMLSGSGIAVLYGSIYTAFNFYHLIEQPTAFALMSVVTLLGAAIADWQRSQGLALMAVGGGFATPFLVSSGGDAQFALFGYDAFLVAGTTTLAHRREWPALNITSYLFTVLTVGAWAAGFYTSSRYLTTELFITLYLAMFLFILQQCRQWTMPSARIAERVLWTAPALYYLASIVILSPHAVAYALFIVALSVIGAGVGKVVGPVARLGFWAMAAVPLWHWIGLHSRSEHTLAGLIALAGVYATHLIAHLLAERPNHQAPQEPDVAVLHANGLVVTAGLYFVIDSAYPDLGAAVVAASALWHGAISASLFARRRAHALHFLALASALLAAAIGIQFEGAAVTAAWAVEGAALTWLGLHERRDWLRGGGVILFAVAVIRLVTLQFSPATLPHAVLLNERAACGLLVIGLSYLIAWLHQKKLGADVTTTEVGFALLTAKLLILALAVSEIQTYWEVAGDFGVAYTAEKVAALSIVGLVIGWMGLRRREEFTRAVGLLVTIAGALLVLVSQLDVLPLTYRAALNPRAAAGLVVVLGLYALSRFHQLLGAYIANLRYWIAGLLYAASVWTLSLVTSEIHAYWIGDMTTSVTDNSFAIAASVSVAWATYAVTLIIVGIRRRYAPIRYFAIGLFGVTIVKVFAVDLAELDRVYRILSIIGLGVALLVASFLYHRFKPALDSSREA